MIKLEEEKFNDIIKQGEGFQMEFKESINANLAKEMVAFANANGGDIIIGIRDSGQKVGIQTSNKDKSKIQDIALNCDPPLYIEISSHTDSTDTSYWLIHVNEGNHKPYRCTSGFYLRQGPNSVKMGTDAIIAFVQSEGRVKFDSQVFKGFHWEDVYDLDLIRKYKALIGAEVEDESVLLSIGAIEGAWPTQAGILMFASRPTVFLPQSSVRCVAFSGFDKVDILDSKDFNGDLITNIEDVIIFMKRHLNISRKISGIKGESILEVPEEVLRETVVNAVLHRDYLIQGAHVMIEIYVDKVVVSSPGALPKGLSEEDFGRRSLARNPVLADILLRTPYIEKLGTGIPRIISALDRAGLGQPTFEFNGFFTVSISRNSVADPVADPVSGPVKITDNQWVKLLLGLNGSASGPANGPVKERLVKELEVLRSKRLNSSTLAKEIGEPRGTVRKDIVRLKQWGAIAFEGPTKTGGYVLSEMALQILQN